MNIHIVLNLLYIFNILLIVGAVVFGVKVGVLFADIDLAPPLPIKHRSAWTHSGLFIVFIGYWNWSGLWQWFFLGLIAGHVIHLAYDCFPKSWQGGATISFYPIPIRLSGVGSFLWLVFAGVFWSAYGLVVLAGNWFILAVICGAVILAGRAYVGAQSATWPGLKWLRGIPFIGLVAKLLDKINQVLPLSVWGVAVGLMGIIFIAP